MPSRSLSILLACGLSAAAASGCTHSIHSIHYETRDGEPEWLATDETFAVSAMSLSGDTLVLSLARECHELRRLTRESVEVQRVSRDVGIGYWAGLTIATSMGLMTALMVGLMVDPGDDPFDDADNSSHGATVALLTAGATAVAAIGGAVADGQIYDNEVVQSQQRVDERVAVACPGGWPQGAATLVAGGRAYEGRARGEGRVEIDLAAAPPQLWLTDGAQQLELAGVARPVQLRLSDDVRQAALARPDVAAAVGPTRSFVWADDERDELLASGAVRVQNVLTSTGRYVFAADAYTRERISRFVAEGGGSLEARLRGALEAANAEDIREVVQLSANEVGPAHVQLVLAVYETGTADRVFLADRAVDGSDGLAVLDTFDQLARDFLTWRGVGLR